MICCEVSPHYPRTLLLQSRAFWREASGEDSGAKTDRLDDVEYRYPTLIVKHLHVWPVQSYGQRKPELSIGAFGGMGVGGGTRRGGGFGIGF
ncbi:MAG: hypothetical protein ABIQ24_01215 [Nitrospiraceae bacterium]